MKRIRFRQTKDSKVFFSSDWHFGHRNIVAGTTRWADTLGPDKKVIPGLPRPYREMSKGEIAEFCRKNQVRPFASPEVMDTTIIGRINELVGPDDILLHLGDWSMGSPVATRNMIACQNIYALFGNHDKQLYDAYMKDGLRLVMPPQAAMEIEVDGQLIHLSHYKHMVWNKKHRGAWHLYGHSHSNFEHVTVGKSMDVGIDNAYKLYGEFRPLDMDDVSSRIKDNDPFLFTLHGREIKDISDHHFFGEDENG